MSNQDYRPLKSPNFLHRLSSVGLPTLFIWLLTFDWIARALPGMQIFIRVSFILLGCAWYAVRLKAGSPLRITKVAWLLLLYVLYSAVLIPNAPLPFHAVEIELSYIFYFLVFLFYLNDIRSPALRNAWHFAFLQAAILFSVFNLYLVTRWWGEWASISGSWFKLPPFGFRLPGLFLQHPNVEAAFLNLILPFLFIGLMKTTDRRHVAGLTSLIILFALSSFFASSRGAWLATISSLGTAFVLMYWDQISKFYRLSLEQRQIKISAHTITILFIGIGVVAGLGLLSYQQARFGGHGGRWGIWQIAWDIFKDAPLLGHGPGSFHVLSAVEARIPPGFYLVHAHNLILQILGESGLIGVSILAAFFIMTIQRIMKAWRVNAGTRVELIPYIAVLVGMGTHQVVDFAYEAPLYTVGILFVLARIDGSEQSSTVGLTRQSVGYAIVLLCILTYSVGSFFTFRGAAEGYTGVTSAQRGDWNEARTQSCFADDINPQNTLYKFQCGLTSAVASLANADDDLLADASSAYQLGLEDDSFWPYHLAAYASIRWQLGDHEAAIMAMRAAQEQAPNDSVLALNLSYYFSWIGEKNLAEDQLQLAYELNPWLWLSSDQNLKPEGNALDPQNLEYYKAKLSPAIFETWKGWMSIQENDFDRAEKAFRTSLEVIPSQVESLAGLAYLAQQQSDLEQAADLTRLARLTGRNSWLLEEVEGNLAYAIGDPDSAYIHWIAASRLWYLSQRLRPYYESVYSRAYIPIDFPPQVIQASLPPVLQENFNHMLHEGPIEIQNELMELSLWTHPMKPFTTE